MPTIEIKLDTATVTFEWGQYGLDEPQKYGMFIEYHNDKGNVWSGGWFTIAETVFEVHRIITGGDLS